MFGSPVSRLQKNQDWTRPRPPRTGNSQDHQKLQLWSSLWSLRILEISRLRKDCSNQSQPVFAVWKVTKVCTVVYKYLCNISTSGFMKSAEIVIGSRVWMWSTMHHVVIMVVFCSYPSHHSLSTQWMCQICMKKVCNQFSMFFYTHSHRTPGTRIPCQQPPPSLSPPTRDVGCFFALLKGSSGKWGSGMV